MTKELGYPYVKEREEAIDKAIAFIKKCSYGGTGLKIELEAQLGRFNITRVCVMCGGQGEFECSGCDGEQEDCSICNGDGYEACHSCQGAGRTELRNSHEMDDAQCDRFIKEHVSKEAREALVHGHTYNDGSVDTEYTFTLPIEKSRYAVEYIRAFNELANHVGNGIATNGAGMHIAILNSSDCNYPGGNSLDRRRADNFKYTMTHLLPALFFLGSADHHSRRLNYRFPRISLSDKYSAINGSKGVFEYRVFETCYQRPEAILDNLCVIANTLRYYHYRKVKLDFFGKVGAFGFKDLGQGIQRFFDTETNYQALMAGVKVLKPSYKTMAELRKERNFNITLTKIKTKERIKENIWKGEYKSQIDNAQKILDDEKTNALARYNTIAQDPQRFGFYETPGSFMSKYPTATKFAEYMIKTNGYSRLAKESEKQFIDKKKSQELSGAAVSCVINI